MLGGGTQVFGWGSDGLFNGTVHRHLLLSRGPVRMVCFSRVTLTWSDVKLTLHHRYHSCLTVRRAPNLVQEICVHGVLLWVSSIGRAYWRVSI